MREQVIKNLEEKKKKLEEERKRKANEKKKKVTDAKKKLEKEEEERKRKAKERTNQLNTMEEKLERIRQIAKKSGLNKCKEGDKICCNRFFDSLKRENLNVKKLILLALHSTKSEKHITRDYFQAYNNC